VIRRAGPAGLEAKRRSRVLIGMELIAAIALAGPAGYLARTPRQGLALYLLAWVLIFPIQTISVDHDGHLDWAYPVVNLVILGLGIALNRLGARLRARRVRRGARKAAHDVVI
jgi:hypothetical protein